MLFADVKGSVEMSEQMDPERWLSEALAGYKQIGAVGHVRRLEGRVLSAES